MRNQDYKLEDSLGYVMGHARRAMVKRLNHDFEKAGHHVTCEQCAILTNLRKKNGQSHKDLSCLTSKDKTSITRLIDVMEKRRLVFRVADKKDARQKLVYLTNKGKALQRQLLDVVEETFIDAQKGITAEDLKICKNVLRQVARNLT